MKPLLFVALTLITTFAFTQDKAQFIENKGQWNSEVQFQVPLVNGSLFLLKTGFTIVQHNAEDISSMSHGKITEQPNTILRSHAVSVSFNNSNNPVIIPEQLETSYNNYFIGNDPSKWTSNCKIAGAVLYKNLYPGIDIRFYANNNGPKYDIIVHPGADISAVSMEYIGATDLTLQENNLNIATTTGKIKETIPYSYTILNGTRQEVSCNYILSGNIVRFAPGNYDRSRILVIDPQLIFSTFTGSTADNWGYTSAYGADGSFYAAGIVFGTGFPVSIGAYQTNFQGGVNEFGAGPYDMAIIKFNSSGSSRVYATYLGGNGNESPMSMIENALGELVIAGRTNSSNYPSTLNIGIGGSDDICITKFSADGTTLLNSRKIGGSGADGMNIRSSTSTSGALSINRNYGDDIRAEIAIDAVGNIVFAGCTRSFDFPTTPTAFQPLFAGLQDGVLLKFDATLTTLLFSSFIGGSGDDGAFAISINNANQNIYVGGSTSSTDFPGDKTGVIGSTYNGGSTEGFISIINASGTNIIKTTYIGTTSNDMLYGLKLDNNNFPYISGTTTGSFPVQNASFFQANGKQFIAKLQPDLSAFIYSTTFGKGQAAPDISITGFHVDNCENVYVIGWGGTINSSQGFPNAGTNGLPVTANALRTTTDNDDLYFLVLAKNAASLLYGSYFGQVNGTTSDHVHGMSRIDQHGVLYQGVCAACGGGSSPFPTTPGSWSVTSGNSTCNMAAVKIAFDLCQSPLPVTFSSFTAECSTSGTQLKWTTATEQNNSRFIVEQSGEGINWKTLGTMPATNNINGSHYNFTDAVSGNALYRIKQTDNNGAYTYSSIVKASCAAATLLLYPVPSGNMCKLMVQYRTMQRINISVIDMMGRKMLEQQHTTSSGSNFFSINTSALSNGNYMIKLTDSEGSRSINLIVNK